MPHARTLQPCAALAALTEQVYAALRAEAQTIMSSERRGHTLSPTALLHEVFIRLQAPDGGRDLTERGFRALFAKSCRHVLVEHARRRAAQKRGGDDFSRVWIDLDALSDRGVALDTIELDEALTALREVGPEFADIAELRLFAGLTHEEVAAECGIALSTAAARWRTARAWLRARLLEERV